MMSNNFVIAVKESLKTETLICEALGHESLNDVV